MNRFMLRAALAAALVAAAPAQAAGVLLRHVTVHTGSAQGTLEDVDVLVKDGVVRAVGSALSSPGGVEEVDGRGRVVTAGLFGGLTAIGLEEVSLEPGTVDQNYAPGVQQPVLDMAWRPEFDVAVAYNPRSPVVPVQRVEGISFTMLAPGSLAGGGFIAGQGAIAVLDGRYDALEGTRALFVNLGTGTLSLAGGSRAAQFMLLEQAIGEARNPAGIGDDARLLSAAGRGALARYAAGGRVVFGVHRAADIRRVLDLAKRWGVKPIIAGAAEGWVVARELAAAKATVLVDPLVNLPGDFDQLDARLDNAALLHAAGVPVGFTQSGDATHNARKIRQLAGNAVAHGLPWDAALAAITTVPADAFGVADRGRIAPGARADLVLWSGDPLEVTTVAERVWIDGVPIPMRTRQTELRDRYVQRLRAASSR